jgi:hypothetical protein
MSGADPGRRGHGCGEFLGVGVMLGGPVTFALLLPPPFSFSFPFPLSLSSPLPALALPVGSLVTGDADTLSRRVQKPEIW